MLFSPWDNYTVIYPLNARHTHTPPDTDRIWFFKAKTLIQYAMRIFKQNQFIAAIENTKTLQL